MRIRLVGLFVSLTVFFVSTPATAAWYEAKSKHFLIYADEPASELQTFAAKLEKFDKAVRIVRGMDDPQLGDAGRVTIFVLKNSDAVSRLAVGKHTDIAGFYIPRASGSIAFVPEDTGGEDEDFSSATVFFHEYSHHLMLSNTDASLPAWLVEGFAEFFSTASFPKDGTVDLGRPANHRALGLYYLDKTRIEDLLSAAGVTMETSDKMEAFYGRSWLLTHYLNFDEKRRGQLAAYVSALRNGQQPLDAAKTVFGDLSQLDRDLDQYLRRNRLEYLAINSPQIAAATAGIGVRPLREGEAAMMPIRIRSTRGVTDSAAHEILGGAEAIAAKYPDDPAVQRALAEAEFDVDNFTGAERAADRALAVDPKFVKALIYKGRAEMELASGTANPDWPRVRGYFLDANRVDPEDPEPLLLYYESYMREGVVPTKNAVDGLLYALVLAPQDHSLRVMAVSQLINDNRLKEAEDALAPLAYDPHSGEFRERARKILEALKKNDRPAALAAMSNDSDPK